LKKKKMRRIQILLRERGDVWGTQPRRKGKKKGKRRKKNLGRLLLGKRKNLHEKKYFTSEVDYDR